MANVKNRKNRRHESRAPGATPEEAALLKAMRIHMLELERTTGISHTTYYKFQRGEPVAQSIRDTIMQFVHKKVQELEELKAALKEK